MAKDSKNSDPRNSDATDSDVMVPAQTARVVVETVIEGSTEAVWRALTEDIGRWWPDEFYAGGDADSRSFHLEAWPGGRMFEDWGDGGGGVWATVLSVESPRRLEVVGHLTGRWGGPSTWLGEWTLEASGDGGTRLRFREDAVGRHGEGYLEDKSKGWRFLFEGALKAHVEGTEPPAWDD